VTGRVRVFIMRRMNHFIMLALAVCWIGANIYLWSMKQKPLLLFSQSLVMAAAAYPAFYWYVRRR
jgi:hypothetical protein